MENYKWAKYLADKLDKGEAWIRQKLLAMKSAKRSRDTSTASVRPGDAQAISGISTMPCPTLRGIAALQKGLSNPFLTASACAASAIQDQQRRSSASALSKGLSANPISSKDYQHQSFANRFTVTADVLSTGQALHISQDGNGLTFVNDASDSTTGPVKPKDPLCEAIDDAVRSING